MIERWTINNWGSNAIYKKVSINSVGTGALNILIGIANQRFSFRLKIEQWDITVGGIGCKIWISHPYIDYPHPKGKYNEK